MNIFYLHPDPYQAAKYQYNKHVVKMVLESAQMLCTAHHHYGLGDKVPYRKAHYNHPSTIWVRESTEHYHWLLDHFIALSDEYQKRYGKRHLAFEKCIDALLHPPAAMPNTGFVEPPQCMPDEYKVEKSAVHGYWRYYIGVKHTVATESETVYTDIPRSAQKCYDNSYCNSI